MKNGWTGATGNYYCGLHEFAEMGFMLHFLREEDYFFDVGSNIGSYSILAGNEALSNVHAFEPIPSTFERLKNNIELNGLLNVKPHNIGLGEEESILKFTTSHDTINHVANAHETDTVDVPVKKFDDLFELSVPTLFKIDVEGFETKVLQGMKNTLGSSHLKAIIMELNGSGGRYGFDEKEIITLFKSYGFNSFFYEPLKRELFEANYGDFDNLIFIKDYDFVSNRINSSKLIEINNIKF